MDKELFNFNKNALQGVITNPLCAEYRADWRKCGDDCRKLTDLLLGQQALPYFTQHCYKGVGVSKKYMLDKFADYINGKYRALNVDGVEGEYYSSLYITDKTVHDLADDVTCFMWSDVPMVEIKPTKAIKLYVACKSEVNLFCGGYNSIVIMLFDESKVNLCYVDEESTVTVYKYSDKASVKEGALCFSEPKVFNKELRL